MVPPEEILSFSIRIPHPSNLGDLKTTVEEVQAVFDGPARLHEGRARIVFRRFDVGSEWFDLAVQAASPHSAVVLYLSVVGLLSAGLRAWMRICKITEQRIKNKTLEVEHEQQELKTKLLKLEVEREAKKLAKEEGFPPTEEVRSVLGAGIRSSAKLYSKGAKVRLSAKAPEPLQKAVSKPTTEAELRKLKEEHILVLVEAETRQRAGKKKKKKKKTGGKKT